MSTFDWSLVLKSPFGFIIIAILVGSLTGMIGTIMSNWRKVRIAEQAAALTQSLAERGMSADEIERVLKAGSLVRNKGC